MKEIKKTIENIRFLVSLARSSVKIREVEIEEKDGVFHLRPQVHVLLRAGTGSLKSTILNYVKRVTDAVYVDTSTTPGLIGTIEAKTFQVVPGVAWTGRKKLLLFDEFTFRKKSDDQIVFLKLLEDQCYSKKFGMFSPGQVETDGDLYFKVEKGSIEIKTRFAGVIATMKRFESFRGENFKALLNRTIPYEFSFSLDELDYLLSRTKLFEPIDYKVKANYLVKYKDYNKIKRYVYSKLEDDRVSRENFARIVGDAVRTHCITGNFSKRVIKNLIDWKLSSYSKIGLFFKK